MSRLSIGDMLKATAARKVKDFSGHDRSTTLGASDVGRCLRQLYYDKNGVAPDASFEQGRGAMDRGDIIEQHYWVPGLRGSLPEGVQLLYAGDEQRTLRSGFSSATPDGLMVGLARDCLAHLGIPDIESDELLVECKSIDPRVSLEKEKAEHTFQLHQQLGLVRETTNHRPMWGLISYVNASFLDDVKEYAVRFDAAVYDAGKQRAKRVFSADGAEARLPMTVPYDEAMRTFGVRPGDPLVPPEGKIYSGGKECEYCAWKGQCAQAIVGAVPAAAPPVSEQDLQLAQRLVNVERQARSRRDEAERELAVASEDIKEFLRTRNTRRVKGPGFTISYTTIQGRKSLDKEAMKADGIDLSLYEREGDPSERLTVVLK